MFNLKPVLLDAADQARMRELNDHTAGVQRMVQMFIESGERRMSELQAEGRTLFESLAKKHNLDLQHVVYVPSPDGTSLIPTQVKLHESA